MPQILHPKFGVVSERPFPSIALEDKRRIDLEGLKEKKLVHEIRIEGDIFTLWRPWIEGKTLAEEFRGLGANDRVGYSRTLFRIAQLKLEELECGHGALHPWNIILRKSGGFELVDAVFNSVLMGTRAVPEVIPWLWESCLPTGWSMEKWDRVSLLRTAALLAQEPSSWAIQRTREDAVELCRRWAGDFVNSFPASSDFIPAILEATNLLSAIREAVFEPPAFPVEDELETLKRRRGKARMLYDRDKEDLRNRSNRQGLGAEAFSQRFELWILRCGFREERELRHLAEEFLAAGLYGNSKKMVTARACTAAERTFTYYGVDSQEAAGYVEELLARMQWVGERRVADQCRQYVAGQVHTGEWVDEAKAEKLSAELGRKYGFPLEIAERAVDLEIERRLLGLVH